MEFKRLVLQWVVLVMVMGMGAAEAKDIYITQSAVGANNGQDCANAHAAAWFNTAANWGSGVTQIGPGTVVHLCGTFTGAPGSTMLTFQGSGSSGNPVTLLFEPGAVLTAPYWSSIAGSGGTAAINLANRSWVVVDGGGPGGTNGIIQCTDNGTAFANQNDVGGINVESTSHVTVQNLWFKDLYVRTALASGTAGFDSAAINGTNATDILVTHNKFTNVRQGFGVAFNQNGQNWESSFNYFYGVEVPNVLATSTDGATWTGASIHDSEFAGGCDLWDDPGNGFHHDGILHFWAQDSSHTAHIYGVQVYNNYLHGIWGNDAAYFASTNGTHITAYAYPEQTGGDTAIFNNVFDLSTGDPRYTSADNGIIFCKSTNSPGMVCNIYNNIFIGPAGNTSYNVVFETDSGGGHSFKNNIIENMGMAYYLSGAANTSIAAANNLYFQVGSSAWNFGTYSAWQASGQDLQGMNGLDPKLDSSYKPQAGAPEIGSGVNLTSLAISALTFDKAGIQRPVTGGWTVGAYSTASAPPPTSPTAPSSLLSTVH